MCGETTIARAAEIGTIEGPLGPIQPTRECSRVQAAFRVNVAGGKIHAIVSHFDTSAVMKQLALVN